MSKIQTGLKKMTCTVLLAISVFAFAGCGSLIKIADFPISDAQTPSTQGTVSYDKQLGTLTVSVKPDVVEKMAQPDKTLYNALFFTSLNGLSKMNVLIGNSYFTYDLLTSTDWNALDKLTEPTNVNITLYTDSSRTQKSVLESAFIFQIDEDYIYLGTAGHCIASREKLKNAVIMFYDRKTYRVDLSTYVLGGGFLSKKGDYAMYRIPTSDIPYEELLKLKQVTYSKQALSNVKQGDYLYSGNIYARNTRKDYDKKLRVINSGDEVYDYYVKYDSYKVLTYDNYYFTEGNLVKGQSGSAIFDRYGNAVGTTSGSGDNKVNGKTYEIGIFTKLYDMDNLYQELKAK